MKRIAAISLIASTLAFGAQSDYKYEVTPMIGVGVTEGDVDLDEQYNFGASIARNLDDSFLNQLEFGIFQSTNTDYDNSNESTHLTKFFLNGVKNLYSFNDALSLYGLAGLGFEAVSNEQNHNDDAGFVNYGLGLRYQMTDILSLKTDIRHLIDTEGDSTGLLTFGLGILFGEKAQPTPVLVEEETIIVEEPAPVVMPKDDDKDGVLNENDKCPNSDPSDIVDKNGCEQRVNLEVNFGFDSAKITNKADNKIEEYATFMKENPESKATIKGHTDSTGPEKYNQQLSEKRANAVKAELENLGIESNRLKAIGFGETRPLVPNDTRANRAQNRRVDAVLSK